RTIVGHPDLEPDVPPLCKLEEDRSYTRPEQGGSIADLRVGEKNVQKEEPCPNEEIGKEMDNNRKQGDPDLYHRGEREGCCCQQPDGGENGQVVRKATQVTPAARHVENSVERLLDVAERRDHGAQQERGPHRAERRGIHVLDETHELIRGGLRAQREITRYQRPQLICFAQTLQHR